MLSRKSGIYKIINNLNGHFYIGSSVNMNRRWYVHRYNARTGSTQCPKLYNVIRKYGIDNFSFTVLLYCNVTDLKYYEQKLLDYYKSDPTVYNISVDATVPMRNKTHTKDAREKMSFMKKGSNHWNYGRSLSDITKDKIGKSHTGIPLSTLHKQKISNSKKHLSDEEVTEIRSLYSTKKLKTTELAKMFGVHRTTISHIVANRTRIETICA